ncbi:hypothetical protein GGP62_001830 [Salinibacter ruber]|uniref:Uncharacterized protein n=1 Tax=Salinibacter ruber TaxID=146919 RepID=A0A9X2Q0W9_9BACT|nr:hypothetical protein [Salinibacter ruber]MCS3659689.1 hypothetical protein [Salinibacter ruber]MCS3706955.1 hypothetical protein [Salinibacter ruber]MCS3709472.1 hypothetical protein [Salinibacter ruber]MCS3821790.1 hypothetical protein [Salinibacter ruber]
MCPEPPDLCRLYRVGGRHGRQRTGFGAGPSVTEAELFLSEAYLATFREQGTSEPGSEYPLMLSAQP